MLPNRDNPYKKTFGNNSDNDVVVEITTNKNQKWDDYEAENLLQVYKEYVNSSTQPDGTKFGVKKINWNDISAIYNRFLPINRQKTSKQIQNKICSMKNTVRNTNTAYNLSGINYNFNTNEISNNPIIKQEYEDAKGPLTDVVSNKQLYLDMAEVFSDSLAVGRTVIPSGDSIKYLSNSSTDNNNTNNNNSLITPNNTSNSSITSQTNSTPSINNSKNEKSNKRSHNYISKDSTLLKQNELYSQLTNESIVNSFNYVEESLKIFQEQFQSEYNDNLINIFSYLAEDKNAKMFYCLNNENRVRVLNSIKKV